MKTHEANIRKAVKEDMKQVFSLIKELAVFEKLEHQIKISADTLEADGFGGDFPAFQCFVAEFQDNIVGYALYYFSYSSFRGRSVFLEDLYVQKEHRGRGIGMKLFLSAAKVAREMRGKMTFHVLSWNPAIKFYEKLGATNITNTEKFTLFRLDQQSFNNLFDN